MEARNQERERMLQEIEGKVGAFHQDKDKAKSPIIKKGYFNALCPTIAEKIKFFERYQEKYPQDKETLKMIEEEIKKQREKEADKTREKYPKDLPEMATILTEDLFKLAGKAARQMGENIRNSQNRRHGNRHVAMSDNVYYDTSMGFEIEKNAQGKRKDRVKFNWFRMFGGRKEKTTPVVERVSLSETRTERMSMMQERPFDDRLQRYNESVRQRAMSGVSKSAPERVNANVMSR